MGTAPKVETYRTPIPKQERKLGLMPDYGPSVKITQLYERESRNGRRYLTGRLGYAKIAVLKSDRTTDDGTQIWDVLMQETPYSGTRQAPKTAPDTEAPIEIPAPVEPYDKTLDDEIPF